MVLSNGDIIQFIHKQQVDARPFLNVDYRRYVDVGLGGNEYFDLAQDYAFGFNIGVTEAIQQTETEGFETELNNVTNGEDFFIRPQSFFGGRAGPKLTILACVTVKQVRRTKITRNGSKRISGLSESNVDGSVVSMGGAQTALVEAFFGTALVGGGGAINDFELEPVIVGRTLNIVTGVYELDLSRVNDVTGAVMAQTVRSQVSRKL